MHYKLILVVTLYMYMYNMYMYNMYMYNMYGVHCMFLYVHVLYFHVAAGDPDEGEEWTENVRIQLLY